MRNATGFDRKPGAAARSGHATLANLALAVVAGFVPVAASTTGQSGQEVRGADAGAAPPSLEETRLAMSKWIETQQILSRERKDWQQGKEILVGRLELIQQEVAALEEKIRQAGSSAAEVERKRGELLVQEADLTAMGGRLTGEVTRMENELRRLLEGIPEPTLARIQLLVQRIPEDPASTRASVAERFQNVLGILNELNKANNEILVGYEVHELADGKPAEVQTLYVGLAQAYYVSARGEAGIGRPTPEGWKWEPSKAVAPQVVKALEVQQGKQSPAFVPLPVRIQ